MTNTHRDLYKRLLRLLSAQLIKERFGEKGKLEDAVEAITGNYSQQAIRDFLFENFLFARQHIYFYELSKNFHLGTFAQDHFPFKIEKQITSGDAAHFYCLPKVTFHVYLNSPPAVEEIVFFQPVMLIAEKKLLRIHYIKLEKDIHSYFPEDREARRARAENEEEESLRSMLNFLEKQYKIEKADLNRGIKHLWKVDDIDCTRIQFRKKHSVSLETMDGKETFKKQYPAEYNEIIKKPLEQSAWKYLKNDGYFCGSFTGNPSIGEISISRFPDSPNQIKNVIAKILANN